MANKEINKKSKDVKSKKIVNKRAQSLKVFSISSVLILLAILLVVNIILSQTLDGILTLDMTSTKQSSVTETTIDYLKTLPDDTEIKIVGLFDLPDSLANTAYEFTVPLLDDLAARSGGKVKVSYVDPDKYPTIINELDPNGVSTITQYKEYALYAVCCGDKIRVIDATNDCFTFNQDYWDAYHMLMPEENKTETVFVNAIVGVTSKSNYKVYYLTDIMEKEHTYLDTIFASMGIEYENLSATEPFSVPDDCSLLIINNPGIDISEGVQEGIKAYISNGSHPVNIICSLGITSENANKDFEHINNVLNEVNLKVLNQNVIDDDQSYVVNSQAMIYKGDLVGEFATYNSAGFMIHQLSRCVAETDRAYSHISSTPLIISSPSCTLLDIDQSTSEGDVVVKSSNVAIGALGQYVGTANPVSVYVFGTGTLTSDDYLIGNSTNEYNRQVTRALINHIMAPETNVDVPYKAIADYSIDYSMVNSSVMSTISVIFIAVIPIMFVVVAAFVYYKRSHL